MTTPLPTLLVTKTEERANKLRQALKCCLAHLIIWETNKVWAKLECDACDQILWCQKFGRLLEKELNAF